MEILHLLTSFDYVLMGALCAILVVSVRGHGHGKH